MRSKGALNLLGQSFKLDNVVQRRMTENHIKISRGKLDVIKIRNFELHVKL